MLDVGLWVHDVESDGRKMSGSGDSYRGLIGIAM